MYVVLNYLTNEKLSRHRSAIAAFKAANLLQRRTQQRNGPTSYVPVSFRREVKGQLVPVDIYAEIGE